MRLLLPSLIFSLSLLACSGGGTDAGDDGAGDADTDTETDTDTDTDDPGTDEDGDGWTVEDGDCDDGDIYVNPAWDEDPTDGKDNDCDGRVDEIWHGMDIAVQSDRGAGKIVTVDTVSRITSEVVLDDPGWMPAAMDHAVDGDGWVFLHDPMGLNISGDISVPESFDLVHANSAGTTTVLATFEDKELYDLGIYPIDKLVTHPDGYYLVSNCKSLFKVTPQGAVEELATWYWMFFEDPSLFELWAKGIKVDQVTGEVGILDWVGGFATWSEQEGFTQVKRADITVDEDGNADWTGWDGMEALALTKVDGGGWYSLVANWNTYVYGLYRMNLGEQTWNEKFVWSVANFFPEAIESNGDNGDLYATANGGWYNTLWLMRYNDGEIDDFYKSDGLEPDWKFTGFVSNY